MLNATELAWLDQQAAHVASVVRQFGWYIQWVGSSCCHPGCADATDDDGPPFAYTVGLFGLRHPELLVFGLPPETAGRLLNDLGGRVRAGQQLLAGQLLTFEWWAQRALLEPVPNPGEIVFTANGYYDRPDEASVPVLQLSYDDDAGRFPWEAGYAGPGVQPRPGSFRA